MRILFITLTNIGDVVLSTPLLHRILADHPDAVVDVVVGAKSADLLAGLPQLGTLYPVVKKRRHGHYIDLYKQCSQTKYDLIVDLRTPLLGRCLKGRKKIIYKPARGHKAQQFASLWPSDAPLKPKVWVHKTPELIEYYEKIRAEARPFIAVAPTANWVGKRWPQGRFAQLMRYIQQDPRFQNHRVVVMGARPERYMVEDFLASLPEDKRIDLVGETNLPQAYAWLKNADMFIGNDSGLGHMAAAAGVPTISLFGPMSELSYAPVGSAVMTVAPPKRERHLVNLEKVALPRVMTDISVDKVYECVVELFDRYKKEEKDIA